MSKELYTAIIALRDKIEQVKDLRRARRLLRLREDPQEDKTEVSSFATSAPVARFFRIVRDGVARDVRRYMASATPEALPPEAAAGADSPFLETLRQEWQWLHDAEIPLRRDGDSDDMVAGAAALSPLAQDYVRRLNRVLDDLDAAQLSNQLTPTSSLTAAVGARLASARVAFISGRQSDALTILKTALRSDPHNHVVLYAFSQLLYLLAATGQSNTLPEARDMAQRSMTPNDRVSADRLFFYQYEALAVERCFGEDRVVEWLRQTDLLNPAMLGNQGLAAHGGVHLRAWALMGSIPARLWGESEVRYLNQLVRSVVGGGVVYLHLIQPQMFKGVEEARASTPLVETAEAYLRQGYARYAPIAAGFNGVGAIQRQYPWTVRDRYLFTFVHAGGVPSFEEVLLHISLDGETYETGCFPDAGFKLELSNSGLHYWLQWATCIAIEQENRPFSPLPSDEMVEEAPLFLECDSLLALLREQEKQRIRANIWDDITGWMVRWHLEHLLAAGTGSNKPRQTFRPSTPPLSQFYARWNDPEPSAILASDIISETARRGAFASIHEVVAAFEGAYRLLDDPVHGLVPSQKRALKAAKQSHPKHFQGVDGDWSLLEDGLTPRRMSVLILPLGLAAGVVFALSVSQTWFQAIGLILAIAGFFGVVAISMSKRPG